MKTGCQRVKSLAVFQRSTNMQKELLRMENIVKTFPGVKALNNAAITVHAGEVMGFMGENGAGKSTLMNVLGGVFPADSGDIYIEGKK